VLGTGPEAQTFVDASQQAAQGYRDIVGFVSQSSDERGETILGLGVLGSVEELGEIIQDYRVEEVIIATSQVTYSRILPFWSSMVGRAVTFKLLPSSFGGSFDVNSRGDDALLLIDLDVPRRGKLQRLLGLG
jgi:FlaA1/EpsC-like NDP-sugar epimerase